VCVCKQHCNCRTHKHACTRTHHERGLVPKGPPTIQGLGFRLIQKSSARKKKILTRKRLTSRSVLSRTALPPHQRHSPTHPIWRYTMRRVAVAQNSTFPRSDNVISSRGVRGWHSVCVCVYMRVCVWVCVCVYVCVCICGGVSVSPCIRPRLPEPGHVAQGNESRQPY